MRGYVNALTAARVAVDYSLHYVAEDINLSGPVWEPAPEMIVQFVEFLTSHPQVTAIYATNAQLGLLALRAVDRLGLSIPDQMSLVCIDPIEAIPLSLPTVTAAVQADEAIGATAMALLQEALAGKPPRTVLLPMQLHRAGSVGPPNPRGRS